MANKKDWIDIKQFVNTYVKVSKANGTSADVAKELGLKTQTVTRRANSLRKRGVELPELRKAERNAMIDEAKAALAEAMASDF